MSTLDASQLAALQDGMSEILDAVSAYRAACEQRGFSPTAAEAMAIEFHKALINAGAE